MPERCQAYWMRRFQDIGALWVHDGNPRRPHAELTSDGRHSNGFFNAGVVAENPTYLDGAAGDLVDLLSREGFSLDVVDWVVGPAMGAITLAHDVARHIGYRRGFPCRCAYAEKEVVDGRKRMVILRSIIKPGARVLLVEDVLTTGQSVGLVADAVREAGGVILPYMAVLVNRSGFTEVDGRKIISLVEKHMPKWTPEECLLCKEGSEAIRPKGVENWARLNAPY